MSNPQIFLKKVWEFTATDWPMAGYSQPGHLNLLVDDYQKGDLILFIVTTGANKGRMVALAEYNPEAINGFDYVSDSVKQGAHNFRDGNIKGNNFRWPHAVPLTRVWEFTERQMYSSMFSKENKQFYDHRTYNSSVRLKDKDAKMILSLPKREIEFGNPNSHARFGKTQQRKPNIFLKKDWGFKLDEFPVVAFHTETYAEHLIRDSQDGDLILYVGIQNSKYKDERGKLLGLTEFDRSGIIETFSYVSEQSKGDNDNYKIDKKGQRVWRWEHGLLMKNALFFSKPRPKYKEFFRENRGAYNAHDRKGAFIRLEDEDRDKVLELLALNSADNFGNDDIVRKKNAKKVSDKISEKKWRRRGFKPTSRNAEMRYDAVGIGYTYAFRFGNKDVWKIGCSQNLERRLSEIKNHVPDEILKENWNRFQSHEHGSPQKAWDMEQQILDSFESKRGERVQCTEEQLLAVWDKIKEKY